MSHHLSANLCLRHIRGPVASALIVATVSLALVQGASADWEVTQQERSEVQRGSQEYLKDESEHFCSKFIKAESEVSYDASAAARLAAVELHCPAGTLADTLKYVNELIAVAFDDPYARVLAPAEAASLDRKMGGTQIAFPGGGLGVLIADDDDKLVPAQAGGSMKPSFTGKVFHVMHGSAAASAGIKAGDVLIAVDGHNVLGLEGDYVTAHFLRGAVGSKLTVTVRRQKQHLQFSLTRTEVKADSVWSRDLGGGLYSVVINQFREGTFAELLAVLEELRPRAVKGIVIDVRDNGGGLFDEAVLCAAAFVNHGLIVTKEARVPGDPGFPEYRKTTYVRKGRRLLEKTVDSRGNVLSYRAVALPRQFFGSKPLVVLVNGDSASAAEVFVGALRENVSLRPALRPTAGKRFGATVIGATTMGKFVGQTLWDGPLGTKIKATSFRFYSPAGQWLGDGNKHRVGITPVVQVEQSQSVRLYSRADAQLNAGVKALHSR